MFEILGHPKQHVQLCFNWTLILSIIISVEPLPNSLQYCQAVPSVSGTGAYATTGSIFYELSSDGSSWIWTLKGTFSEFPFSPAVMTLPPGYTC